MGMFDSIYVHKSLIHSLVSEYGFETEMTTWEDWYSFQTKDLDNFLTNFFIDKDGNFTWEKRNEIFEVSISDACTNPWTMMVMCLDTDTTLTAMKGSWRSQMIASVAITQLIMSFLLIYFYCSLSSYVTFFNRQIFKFFEAVKFIYGIS